MSCTARHGACRWRKRKPPGILPTSPPSAQCGRVSWPAPLRCWSETERAGRRVIPAAAGWHPGQADSPPKRGPSLDSEHRIPARGRLPRRRSGRSIRQRGEGSQARREGSPRPATEAWPRIRSHREGESSFRRARPHPCRTGRRRATIGKRAASLLGARGLRAAPQVHRAIRRDYRSSCHWSSIGRSAHARKLVHCRHETLITNRSVRPQPPLSRGPWRQFALPLGAAAW